MIDKVPDNYLSVSEITGLIRSVLTDDMTAVSDLLKNSSWCYLREGVKDVVHDCSVLLTRRGYSVVVTHYIGLSHGTIEVPLCGKEVDYLLGNLLPRLLNRVSYYRGFREVVENKYLLRYYIKNKEEVMLNIQPLKISDGKVTCWCCKGSGRVDEGHGEEECTACSGTGEEQ